MSNLSHAQRAPHVRRGFTLIELLVVIAIIMLLAGMLFPAFTAAREMGRRTKAKADVKQLDSAWRAFLSDYRSWQGLSGGDMNNSKVSVLKGTDNTTNPKGVIYMEFDSASTDASGNFVDPWYNKNNPSLTPNNVYKIALGSGGTILYNGSTVYRDVGAWSVGKDGTVGTSDDIKSW